MAEEEKSNNSNGIYSPSNKYLLFMSSGQQYIVTGDVFQTITTQMQQVITPKFINVQAAYPINSLISHSVWLTLIHIANVQLYQGN